MNMNIIILNLKINYYNFTSNLRWESRSGKIWIEHQARAGLIVANFHCDFRLHFWWNMLYEKTFTLYLSSRLRQAYCLLLCWFQLLILWYGLRKMPVALKILKVIYDYKLIIIVLWKGVRIPRSQLHYEIDGETKPKNMMKVWL